MLSSCIKVFFVIILRQVRPQAVVRRGGAGRRAAARAALLRAGVAGRRALGRLTSPARHSAAPRQDDRHGARVCLYCVSLIVFTFYYSLFPH